MLPTSPIPELPSTSAPGDALRGLLLPFRAFGLIIRTPKLLGLSLLCAAVTGLTLLGVGVGAWRLGHWLAEKLISGDGWQHAASLGLGVVFFIVLFAVGALTAPNLLLAPLQDPLSEATEVRCGNFTPAPFSLGGTVRGTLESLSHTLLRLAFMTAGLVVLFPLNLIPAVGSVAYLVLSSVWSMFWLAVEHLSNPMARHLRPFRQVVAALRRRLPLALGVGAALSVMLWVPVLNFFLMPVAVVAGTLLYRALEQVNALPES
ncbi:MAG: EI24 domain-containing protein [Myxococcota bacterium]